MRNQNCLRGFLASLSLCALAGCGTATQKSTVATVQPIDISGQAQVRAGQSVTFAATVPQNAPVNLSWEVNGIQGGNATLGTIDSSGTYTAPTQVPSPNVVTVSVTSSDSSLSPASAPLTLLNPSPSLTAASVASVSSNAFSLTLTGAGFVAGSQILVNQTPYVPSQISPTSLQVGISQVSLQVSSITVQVQNPDPGGSLSNSVTATVSQSAASITAATRILDQAAFGPTFSDIAHVQQVGIAGYLNEQFQQPASQMPAESWLYAALDAGCKPFYQCPPDSYWMQYAVFGPDQLRQRIAYTLSKLWTVSYDSTPPEYFPYLLNVFSRDAFSNWRQIMQDVTLSAAMGNYLNMANNMVQSSADRPDENYGREFLQVFNLGPSRLNPDGSLQLNSSGNTIPVYTQDQVVGYSKVFTGYTYANDNCSAPATPTLIGTSGYLPGLNCPMVPLETYHDHSEKQLLNGVVLPAGQTANEDLNGAIDSVFEDPNLPPYVVEFLIRDLVKSNPSPDYIARASAVFMDDGKGVRGNMQAVVSEILLDPEARQDDDPSSTSPDAGHLRDPLSWSLAVLRALNPTQTGDESAFRGVEYAVGFFGAPAHSAPSVFGFYAQNYVIPGTSIVGPEFQLETPGDIFSEMNILESDWIRVPVIGPSSTGASLTLDLSATGQLGTLATQGVEPLLDGIDTLFYHGKMGSDVRSAFETALRDLSPAQMVRVAVYLAVTSPQFRVNQ